MKKYKIEVYDKQEQLIEREYPDYEWELYAEIGKAMWDDDKEIMGIFYYDLAENRVSKGEIKWDSENNRFYVEWQIVWIA